LAGKRRPSLVEDGLGYVVIIVIVIVISSSLLALLKRFASFDLF
jgi:hypothetical protein